MKLKISVYALSLVLLTACSGPTPFAHAPAELATDGHNARNSLDWNGSYEGILPCADCEGMKVRLTLKLDGSYELRTWYLGRPTPPELTHGNFTWQADGAHIRLDAAGHGQIFFIAEERIFWLQPDGTRVDGPQADSYVLKRVRKA